MYIVILLKLLFAHFISDFILQTDTICKGKKKKGITKFGFLFLHSLIHAVTAYLLIAQWSNWIVPVVILITHYLVDYAKLTYKKEDTASFIIDQIIHIFIIFFLWGYLFQENAVWCIWFKNNWNDPKVWAIAVAYLLVIRPTSVFLNSFIKRWTPNDSKDESLPILPLLQ